MRRGLVVLAALAGLFFAAPGAAASPPRPADLRVVGGDVWHANRHFQLTWNSPQPSDPALVLTRYRVRDPQGNPIETGSVMGTEDGIGLSLESPVPGSYTAEAWFEDADGAPGPVATAQLRFDDVRPPAIGPVLVPAWIGRTAFPLRIRLDHPLGSPPLSGIRGYAVAIGASPSGVPCAAPDRCTDAETTLSGGVTSDTLAIAGLPEGTSHLSAVAVSGSGMKSATIGRAVLHVDLTDPVTRLSGVPAGWTSRTVHLIAHAEDDGSGMATTGDGHSPFTAIRVDGGAPRTTPGELAEASVIGEGTHRIAYYARDAAGNIADGGESNGIANRAPRTASVRIDRTPPRVVFANSQNPRDPDLLRALIADPLSGPDPVRGTIGIRRAGSGDGFRPLPTAVSANGELRARWDSDAYPAGDYEFRSIGYDLAGNAAATVRRRNGSPLILSNPLKASTSLAASLAGHQLELAVPCGRGVSLSGRLTTGIRSPLGEAPVRIVERFATGPGPAIRTSTVRTERNGTYSTRLAPGPNRTVVATFAGSSTLSRSESAPLRLIVRSAVRLRASSAVAKVGGAPLVFRGRVAPAEAIPAKGKSVQLQFRLPGLPWSEFRTIESGRRGRFRYAYRFSDDDSRGARFQFRAYVPAQDDWPYEPGGSPPVTVRGI